MIGSRGKRIDMIDEQQRFSKVEVKYENNLPKYGHLSKYF